MRDPQVLIVGGGPVGLAAAIELGTRGVKTLVIEKQSRVGYHPRAKTTHVRTVGLMRRWGLAEALRQASPLPADYPTDVIFMTRLNGHELAHFRNAFHGNRARDARFPEAAQWIPQYKVEATLRAKVSTLPCVELREGVEFRAAHRHDNAVSVEIADLATGSTSRVHVDYVIGADGLASSVRRDLGISMSGERNLGANVNVVLRSPDLTRARPAKRAIMYWICNPEAPCALAPMDVDDIWAFIGPLPPDPQALTHAAIRERLDKAVGRPVECEILAVDPWTASRASADSYGGERIYLAGDACHVHPPFGGYGMNLGIGDAVDLGWKIAARLQGWGGDALLDSYELERRPVHDAIMDEAVNNNRFSPAELIHPKMEDANAEGDAARALITQRILEQKINEFDTLGIVLGAAYAGSPIIAPGDAAPPSLSRLYTPADAPGCLAPHAWLADGSSLYDHFGSGFCLLATVGGHEAKIMEFEVAARARGLPLKMLRLVADGLSEIYARPLTLVRPDQYIAWRGDLVDEQAGAVLDHARGAG